MLYHVIDHWATPASAYPRRQIGDWAITTRQQPPGIYRMQDEGAFYYHAQPILLTVLTEGDKVWFTDEPRNAYALAEIGLFRARGQVVVGGLGLGLIHHFLKLNPNVTSILTVEQAAEQKSLVWPYVSAGELIIGDFYDVMLDLARGHETDTIITDFIFGYQSLHTWAELEKQRDFCRQYFPNAQFLEHGYQRRMDAEVVAAQVPASKLMPEGTMFDQVRIVR